MKHHKTMQPPKPPKEFKKSLKTYLEWSGTEPKQKNVDFLNEFDEYKDGRSLTDEEFDDLNRRYVDLTNLRLN